MLLRKISLCALIAFAVNTSFAGRTDLESVINAKNESRQIEHRESALRALAVAFLGGFIATSQFGNTFNAHVVGVGLTSSGNILFGELAFKDRNYWAQLAGMTFGYLAGSVAGDIVNKNKR